MKYLNSSAA